MRTEERDLLEQSLLRDGCRESLTVWKETGFLLDGHNRHDICTFYFGADGGRLLQVFGELGVVTTPAAKEA